MEDKDGIFGDIVNFLLPECKTKSCSSAGNYRTRFSKQLVKLQPDVQEKVVEYILWMTYLTERVRIFQITMLIDVYSLMRMLYYIGYGDLGKSSNELIKEIVALEQQVNKEPGGGVLRVVDPNTDSLRLQKSETLQLLNAKKNMLDLSTGHNIVVCYGGERECEEGYWLRDCKGKMNFRQKCQPKQGNLGVCYSPDEQYSPNKTSFRGHASGPSFFLDLMFSKEVESKSINNYLDKKRELGYLTDTVPIINIPIINIPKI